jgi:hypothetical protein
MPVNLLAEISANKFVKKHKADSFHFLAEISAKNHKDEIQHFVAEYSANIFDIFFIKKIIFLF